MQKKLGLPQFGQIICSEPAEMSMLNLRRLSGVFNETETRALRDAYLLALHALSITHDVDEALKARLADIVIRIFMTEGEPNHRYFVDTSALAARSVERYVNFNDLYHAAGVTLH